MKRATLTKVILASILAAGLSQSSISAPANQNGTPVYSLGSPAIGSVPSYLGTDKGSVVPTPVSITSTNLVSPWFSAAPRQYGDGYESWTTSWKNASVLRVPGEEPGDEIALTFYDYGASIFFRHDAARQLEVHTWRAGGPTALATFVSHDTSNQFQVRDMWDSNSLTLTYPQDGDPTISTETGNVSLKLSASGSGEVYTDKTFTAPSLVASQSIVLNGVAKTSWTPAPVPLSNMVWLTPADSGKLFTDATASDRVPVILPAPTPGLEFTFVTANGGGWIIYASSLATIRIAGSVGVPNGDALNNTVGDVITFTAINGTSWFATKMVGTGWTVE